MGDRYKLLIEIVIPGPIAFVTMVDEAEWSTQAPFSFFNCLSSDPAIVAIGVKIIPTCATRTPATMFA